MVDGTVYIMFLKGQREQPDNKYVGVTTMSLSERLKIHISCQTKMSRGECDSKVCGTMRDKGVENWDIEPLAELWLSTNDDLRDLEKYYIRVLKPDEHTGRVHE